MANSYTVNNETVFGTWRVQEGTLTLTDGANDGSSTYLADTGMHNIIFAVENSTTPCRITHTGGNIGASSAGSGSTITSGSALKVLVFGK